MNRIRCFLVEPSPRAALYLRRYVSSGEIGAHYHEAMSARFRVVDIEINEEEGWWHVPHQNISHDEEEWPTHCECGYEFKDTDVWQEFVDRIYEAVPPNDGSWAHRELPPGAMFYCNWLTQSFFWDNSSGDCLVVKTPGGEWVIDARASNCTLPDENTHRCWVRHGVPPDITVDKVGHTCSAGAGSILQSGWHGFLRNGYLEEC